MDNKTKLRDEDFKYFVGRLLDYANDAVEESKQNKEDDFLAGKRMAYFEMVSTLQSDLNIEEQDLSEYGLDFDPIEMLND